MNEIEQKAVRKDGDATMCDLLDKEIEQLATDNNVACKEIEEMAKVLFDYRMSYDDCVAGSEDNIAKYLVEQGYRRKYEVWYLISELQKQYGVEVQE